MTEERQIEETARLDGREFCPSCLEAMHHLNYVCRSCFKWRKRCPDYLNDDSAAQRVINGLANRKCSGYMRELREIVIRDSGMCYAEEVGDGLWYDFPFQLVKEIVKATPSQKCEAILRAVGKWDFCTV